MRRLTYFITFCIILVESPLLAQKDLINLGVVIDCPQSSTASLMDVVLRETQVLLASDYQVQLDPDNILQSDCDINKAKQNLDALLSDDAIDIILGMDALGSHAMAKNGPYPKPVIAGIIINAQVQKIPITKKGRSGVKNLTYVELPYSPMRDMEVFHEMIGFEKAAMILDEAVFNGIPEIKEFLDNSLNELNVAHEFVFTDSEANEVLNRLDDSFDASYLFPSDILSDAEYQLLIDGLRAKKLKSFSILGRLDVDRGVLASVAPASNVDLLARRIALNIQRIANGEDPDDINVKLLQKEEFVINMATAREIDYSPNWETLSEAILINEERDDIERTIDLFEAIAEGLEQNLTIDIAKKDVQIAEQEVNIAQSLLLPELGCQRSSYTG